MSATADQEQSFAHAMAAVVRRADAGWTTADEAALTRWRRADPRHEQALIRAEALWQRFEIVPPAWDHVEREASGLTRRRAIMGIAALALAPVVYAVTPVGILADYRSGPGERRSIALADGSSVELGTSSALSLGRDPRAFLLDEGEAYFQITPASQPFRVEALNARIEAGAGLASAFALRAVRRQGLLAVSAGRVGLTLENGQRRDLGPGQELHFTAGAATPVTATAPDDVASWRQNRLVFSDAPLGAVLSELGRYRRGWIATDPRVAGIRLTAVFDTTDIPAAFAGISETLPVRFVDTGVALIAMPA